MGSLNELCDERGGNGVGSYNFTLAGLFELKLVWQNNLFFQLTLYLFKGCFQSIFSFVSCKKKQQDFIIPFKHRQSQALSFGALIENKWLQSSQEWLE